MAEKQPRCPWSEGSLLLVCQHQRPSDGGEKRILYTVPPSKKPVARTSLAEPCCAVNVAGAVNVAASSTRNAFGTVAPVAAREPDSAGPVKESSSSPQRSTLAGCRC